MVAIALLAAGRVELNASRLSVVRTILNCALALSLGFLGSRWKHVELGWVAYAAVAFGTLKLVFEDLRFGNAASLVVSLSILWIDTDPSAKVDAPQPYRILSSAS